MEGWSRDELGNLKRAAREYSSSSLDKNERWSVVARAVGGGRSKKECYTCYKELKSQRARREVSAESRYAAAEPTDAEVRRRRRRATPRGVAPV